MQNLPKFGFDNWHLDELKVSRDDNICKLIYRKCHLKSCYSDINSHMTLETIFSVVKDCICFPGWIQVGLSQCEHNTWQDLKEE
jgi:hypothetical protein